MDVIRIVAVAACFVGNMLSVNITWSVIMRDHILFDIISIAVK